ncbi:MAG: UDP-N-acetylmuramoyl-L-alanine--D-glutamate ligase [Candidatus Latescibacterota bacterium]|nr:MAG: UDP-N-acetylmuramoyl-L-alanine--D-glutamate ligase [Candidatus Latescibacterota bacterium]
MPEPGHNEPQVAGRRVVVHGLARSGRAAAELLRERGAQVVGVDEGSFPREWARRTLAAIYSSADPGALADAVLFVLSPGIPDTHPLVRAARQRGIPVVSEIELAYRFAPGSLIAITGSKGKSTTAALTGHLLEALGVEHVVAGNIGVPFSAVVASLRPRHWIVLEVSSFQLETIDAFHARAAVQLRISPDHLDRYPDIEAYAAAKARVAQRQTAEDLLVVAPDDTWGARLASVSAARVAGFATTWKETGVVRDGDALVWRTPESQQVLARVQDVPLLGSHNLENAMAALAILAGLGLWEERARAALRTFRGLEFRMQSCGEISGIHFVNDSKSTTVESVRAAVRGMPGALLLALGGRNKGLDFRSLRDDLAAVRVVFLYGESAPQLARDLAGAAHLERVSDLDALLRRALEIGQPGDTLLFSPGCTSFDQFDNAEHRGREFDAAVERVREAMHA